MSRRQLYPGVFVVLFSMDLKMPRPIIRCNKFLTTPVRTGRGALSRLMNRTGFVHEDRIRAGAGSRKKILLPGRRIICPSAVRRYAIVATSWRVRFTALTSADPALVRIL